MKEIYKILIQICGAPPREMARFEQYMKEPHLSYEWRFQGRLGFGGIFHKNDDVLRVSCYQEDETPHRINLMKQANAALKKLSL